MSEGPVRLRARPPRKENEIMTICPIVDLLKTGQNITRLRIKAGLSVKNLQDIFGFATPNAIYKWQNGAALPTVDNLLVLSVVFNVKIDDIIVVADTVTTAAFSA